MKNQKYTYLKNEDFTKTNFGIINPNTTLVYVNLENMDYADLPKIPINFTFTLEKSSNLAVTIALVSVFILFCLIAIMCHRN